MEKICPKCGAPADDDGFCAECGAETPAPVPEPEPEPAPEPAPAPEPEPAPGGKGLLIAIAALLAVGAAVAVLFITGVFGGALQSASSAESGVSESAPGSSEERPSSSSSYEQSDVPESSESGYSFEGVPDFVAHGMDAYLMQPLEVYSYMTDDLYGEGTIAGTLRVVSYGKGELSDEALAFAEEKDVDLTGYESRRVVFDIEFNGGLPDIGYVLSDYYNSETFEGSYDSIGVSADGEWEYSGAQIEIDGGIETIFILLSIDSGDEDDAYIGSDTWEFLVPEGYDGVCCGYYNTMLDQSEQYQEGEYCYQFFDKDNMFFFRCA